jgi:voltage-gated potassium channel
MRSLPKLLGILIVAVTALVVACSVILMVVEDLDPLETFYFAVVTVTTVGYGDIHPKTNLGMILSVVMILGGVCIFTGGVGLIANAIVSKRDSEAAEAKTRLLLRLFMNTMGVELLDRFNASNPEIERLRTKLSQYDLSAEKEVKRAKQDLVTSDFVVDMNRVDSKEWRSFLKSHSQVFLVLLSNPAVSEGVRVTSVLQRTYDLDLALEAFMSAAPTDSADWLRSELENIYYEMTLLWIDYAAAVFRAYRHAVSNLSVSNPFRETKS